MSGLFEWVLAHMASPYTLTLSVRSKLARPNRLSRCRGSAMPVTSSIRDCSQSPPTMDSSWRGEPKLKGAAAPPGPNCVPRKGQLAKVVAPALHPTISPPRVALARPTWYWVRYWGNPGLPLGLAGLSMVLYPTWFQGRVLFRTPLSLACVP